MDVIEIPKTGDKFRVLYETKRLHKAEETKFKLCKVVKKSVVKKELLTSLPTMEEHLASPTPT